MTTERLHGEIAARPDPRNWAGDRRTGSPRVGSWHLLLAGGLALAVLLLGSIGLVREIDRITAPPVRLVADGGALLVTESGVRANGLLRVGDRILLVDGAQQRSAEELETTLSRGGRESTVVLLRNGEPVTIPFSPAPPRPDWDRIFLVLVGTATTLLALAVLRRAPAEPGALPFAGAAIALGAVLLLTPGRYDVTGRILFLAEELARILAPPLLVHFALRAPAGGPRARVWPFYLPALLLAAAEADLYLAGGRFLRPDPAAAMLRFDRAFFLHLGLAAAIAVAIWTARFARTRHGEEVRRLRWLLAGIAGGLFPVVLLGGFARLLGPDWRWAAHLSLVSLALVPLGAAAALVRFRLEEIDRLVARAAALAGTLVAALAAVAAVDLAVAWLVPALAGGTRHLAALSAGFGVAAALAPARRFLGDSILRIQKRAGDRERRALVDFTRQLAVHEDPTEIGEELLRRLEQDLRLERVNLYLPAGGGGLLRLRLDPDLPPELPRPAAVGDLPEVEGFDLFPMISRQELAGILLTAGREGVRADAEERSLLELLAATAAVAIDNARLYRELSARDRLATVGRVAASVAHEVNTPLAGISSFAQMLIEETPEGDPRRPLLARIEGETFRASRIVRDVLEMARGGEIARERIDLRDVARGALDAVTVPLRGASVKVDLALGEVPTTILGDAPRLERATVNLLLNAKDAAPGGTIRVEVLPSAGEAILRIVDQGAGLASADRLRAFETLRTTKGQAGTGLGLGLAAEVVRAHGGSIRLEPAPGGRGAAVTIRLPLADPKERPA
jgi:signal transduction histidine kinase